MPPSELKEKEKEKEKEKKEGDEEKEEEKEDEPNEKFRKEIVTRARLGTYAGEAIASLADLQMITPRGKFTLDMFNTFLKFHGSSYDYRIEYSNITKMFMLDKPDNLHMMFVIGLSNPLSQGRTYYPFIVLNIKKDREEMVNLNTSDEAIKSKLSDSIVEGPLHDVMSKLFSAFTGNSVILSSGFRSTQGDTGVKCSVKASYGYLYPLPKCLLFVNKPVIFIKYKDVSEIRFSRIGDAMQRCFDIKVVTSEGSHQFLNLDRSEHRGIVSFLKGKGIRVVNEDDPQGSMQDLDLDSGEEEKLPARRARQTNLVDMADLPEDDSDDEEFDPNAVEESDMDFDDEDEDLDEDEDFGSEDDEDDEDEGKSKKKKSKKDKKEKKSKKDKKEKKEKKSKK
eukprot:CAMPEP_0115021330 /NCGR_PEP_ID=MMETSP0216-20121206/30818_1 /TAXON_ID=223996 /ORGANISM="Protocruzia adherens, Strain Boccale" /LENGTH=393 /DNA_ID=CAMNT_0002393657 /DNA_START=359 /DNA_END=1540 /DNA_ORIENTATION=-